MRETSSDRLVCFMCGEDTHDLFMANLAAGEKWSCAICGCNRVVLTRFYQDDFGAKVTILRKAHTDRQRRIQTLQERARTDAQSVMVGKPTLTGAEIADMLERALSECQVGSATSADAYLQVFFGVLRNAGIDIDGPLAAVGLRLCWWCRRPVSDEPSEHDMSRARRR